MELKKMDLGNGWMLVAFVEGGEWSVGRTNGEDGDTYDSGTEDTAEAAKGMALDAFAAAVDDAWGR